MAKTIASLIQATAVAAALALLPLGTAALLPNQSLISLGSAGTPAQIGSGVAGDEAKMMMPNPFSYKYLAGANLDDKTGTGRVFELQLIGEPRNILKTVAKAMGVSGEVYEPEYSTKEYPAFAIGSKDGTGESVNIYFSGTGNWWYNNSAAWNSPMMPVCGEPTTEGDISCTGPEPTPELLPTREEILQDASRIFTATGLEVTQDQINVSMNEWGATASASMQIDNQNSPIEWSVSWGSNGLIASVSGHSVKPIDRGEFPTISTKEAVSRMSDWRYSGQLAQWVWAKYQPEFGGGMIAYDDLAENSQISTDDSQEPRPEPSPSTITVTINQAETVQVMIWDKQGHAWIVPGYILIGEKGWITPVFSLNDGVVELPAPVEISPMVR